MPSKNKFPLSGLSKQQKEILKSLYDDKYGFKSTKELSWVIAKKFDNEQDSRIEKRKSRYENFGRKREKREMPSTLGWQSLGENSGYLM